MIKGEPLVVLRNVGGYYDSPRGSNGEILGPIVAYAGKYQDGETEKQWVGPDYFNFAKAEQDPDVRSYFADNVVHKLFAVIAHRPTVVIAMPMGGILWSVDIGRMLGCRTIFAEKKIIALADPSKGLKEISELIIDRHEIFPDDHAVISEDVCNNYSTTQKAFDLITGRGAKFEGIVTAVNRSDTEEWNGYPVISTAFKPSKQYRQDDPAVAKLIADGKIVWKPKQQWPVLKEAMEKHVAENGATAQPSNGENFDRPKVEQFLDRKEPTLNLDGMLP